MLTFLAALIYKEQRRANREMFSAGSDDAGTFVAYALIAFFLWPLVIFGAFDRYAQRPGVGLVVATLLCAPVLIFLSWPGYLVAGFIFMCIGMFIVFSAVLSIEDDE